MIVLYIKLQIIAIAPYVSPPHYVSPCKTCVSSVNVVSKRSPSRIRIVLLISFGITTTLPIVKSNQRIKEE